LALAIGLSSGVLDHGPALAQPAQPDRWTACRAELQQRPDSYESAYCFYTAALQHPVWPVALQRYQKLLTEYPDNPWLVLTFGHLQRSGRPGTDNARAERFYLQAADDFRAARQAEGEILARIGLRDLLAPQGRTSEAAAAVTRALEIAASVNEPVLKARVWTLEASHVLDTGGDLGHAYRLLKQAERAVFPDGPYALRRTCLGWLGLVAFRMGRLDEAIRIFRRLDALARANGDLQSEASARYNILNIELASENMLPVDVNRERLLRLAREALDSGTQASFPAATLKAHRVLGELLAGDAASRTDALHHAERCLAMAVTVNRAEDEALCAWLAASLLHEREPAKARSAQSRALAATARANNPATEAVSATRHMQFAWLSRPRSDAIRDSLAALDTIETLRRLQDTVQSAAEAFSLRTPEYYWLSGRLVLGGSSDDVGLAFSITERLRARALLDTRARAPAPADPAHPAVTERRALLRNIAAAQRRLLDPSLAEPDRQTILARLDLLEEREQSAARLAALSTKGTRTAERTFAGLADVQAALREDEALLSFQIGVSTTSDGNFGGGSWLIAVTSGHHATYRIPDRPHFAARIPIFTGLLSRNDGLETHAAVRLYADVFSGALRHLGPSIKRLILVPDGPLHQLPFDVLRPGSRSEPLGVSYELYVTPSATLWLDWRRSSPVPTRRRALALADPELIAATSTTAPGERSGVLDRGLALARLPHARRESRAIERALGAVDTLDGALASEHVVKTRELRDYQILHFAAHAVADDVRPERSALFLAPGSENEDGLLQRREIAELDLDGRIVVLSACRTASGAVVNGEGMLSLARAFLEAGARAVVGTRWPIRDEDAATLFESFYGHLGRGVSLASALASTRREAIASGRTPQVWAALVLLGDGTLHPFADERGDSAFPARTLALALVTCIVAAWCLTSLWRHVTSRRQ
jgi:tetratricopeptide (TPR) repeat protein